MYYNYFIGQLSSDNKDIQFAIKPSDDQFDDDAISNNNKNSHKQNSWIFVRTSTMEN